MSKPTIICAHPRITYAHRPYSAGATHVIVTMHGQITAPTIALLRERMRAHAIRLWRTHPRVSQALTAAIARFPDTPTPTPASEATP